MTKSNESPRVSLIVPCYGRPQRTRRMIDYIGSQTINNFELFLIGDGCPAFQDLLSSNNFNLWLEQMKSKGNYVTAFNLDKNYGGYGYQVINYGIQHALGKYIMFAANDDVIAADHLEFYLSEIENTDLDVVCYTTAVVPNNTIRRPKFQHGQIGHSELIIKASTAQRMPPHSNLYGHDWEFIQCLINTNSKIKISENTQKQTYFVMSVGKEQNRQDNHLD